MAVDQTLQNYDIAPANNHPKSADDGSDTGPYPFWQTVSGVEANLRLFTIEAEWVSYLGIMGVVVAFLNATTATLGSVDFTANWRVGRRVKALGVAGGPIYGNIATSVYAAGTMTVTVNWDSGALDAGLTDLQLGLVGLDSQGPTARPIYGGAATGTDTYAVVLNPTPSSLAALVGIPIFVTFANANLTTAPTLAPNGLAATNIKKFSGGVLVAPAIGDIPAGAVLMLMYDGVQFQLLAVGAAAATAGGLATQNISAGTPSTVAYAALSGTLNLTAPATGGPYRLLVAYYVAVAINGTNQVQLEMRVTDGTNHWAFGGVSLNASAAHIGTAVQASDVSPVTYAAGAAVVVNVEAWANSTTGGLTCGGTSFLSGAQSYVRGWFVPSN